MLFRSPLKLKLLASRGSKDFEAIVQNYLEHWKKLGVRVELVNGRLQDYHTVTDKVLNDSHDFDMWMLGCSVGAEPTMHALSYLPKAPYNFGHFATKENTELIDSFTRSPKAFNQKYLLQQFYKWQGKISANTHDDDFIESFFVSDTHDTILFITDKGQLYWLKVYRIPEASRTAIGKAVVNLINLSPDEKIMATITTKDFNSDKSLAFFTKNGIIKRTNLSEIGRAHV